jgi:tRNA pseudouridine38-40 synthase
MPRYRITIEYDGTSFAGWQRQTDCASVQGVIEEAILKFSGETVGVRGAGRTDAGVHALAQVAHFDLSKDWDPFRIAAAINFHVKPFPAAVLACEHVSSDFDARFSAVQRHYLYRILVRRAPPVIERNRVWWLTGDLDTARMAEAATEFIGHRDFTTFRASQCQAPSPMKTLEAFDVTRDAGIVSFRVSARSFLHSQVRSMVGSLKLVGDGTWTKADLNAALEARDRTACGTVAPAAGLYLVKVDYPAGFTPVAGLRLPSPETPDA